jgi:ribonuclease VapC
VIVDSSALAAIIFKEPDGSILLDTLMSTSEIAMSAATYLEISIAVIRRHGVGGFAALREIMELTGIVIEPLTETQADLAVQAYTTYGKGRHRATLNYGDCISYALAKETGRPLLYKGQDFPETDLPPSPVLSL